MARTLRGISTTWLPILVAGSLLPACSGSGSTPSGASSSSFSLSTTGVVDGQTWQINRPIKFTFTQSVDFDTVNLNTINIQRIDGAPVLGEFSLDPSDLDPVDGLPRAVLFRPACPTQDDFSDAGLLPGSTYYQVNVLEASGGATTVRSLRSGQSVQQGRTLYFRTPDAVVLSELFLDTALGPPAPLYSDGFIDGCRVEVIDPETGEVVKKPFILDETGTGNLETGYLVPNNFYSVPTTWVDIYLEFNQAVSPTTDNISSSRLRLEYETMKGSGDWATIPTLLDLVANCSETGSTVRMRPVGILPQDRPMRIVVSAQFEDLVGDRNIVALDRFALMDTDAELDGGGAPRETADEVLERFNPETSIFEDLTGALDTPRANWGDPATGEEGLQAAFAFKGTGGPNGDFDLVIKGGKEVVFDTTSTMFIGGPNGSPQTSVLAVSGKLDVRDLIVEEGSSLRIQGPNPSEIYASRNVIVEGTISINGSSAPPVFTLNTPNQPESGAAGQGGGGDGGTGSYLTTQVTQRGGHGYGAFNRPNLGGEGGESGWHPSDQDLGIRRRAGGGGGGQLGHDFMVYGLDGETPCPYEIMIGLNAEAGFVGHDEGISSQGPHIPYGGHIGPSPFSDIAGTEDDFLGTKRKLFDTPDEVLVVGELAFPMPGAGGGAGGDGTWTDTYPPPELIYNRQEKGAGGGGGAGALSIRALGNIIVSGTGQITAIGGHGNGGENTLYVNRVGGGSGGGSGGHIILEAGGTIDLSGVATGSVAVVSRGGEGGAGEGDKGGAAAGEKSYWDDGKHPGWPTPPSIAAKNVDNPWIPTLPETCIDLNASLHGGQRYVLRCAGGDGGPGLVQMHVGSLSGAPATHDVKYPGDDDATLWNVCYPPPVGYDPLAQKWVDHLLPTFGRFSKAQSKWMPLGAAAVAPGTSVPDPLTFLFDGIDPATGFIEVTGETVDELDPMLEPVNPIEANGTPEFMTPNTVRFDAGELEADEQIYKRNPSLLRSFRLTVGTETYDVASATYDETEDTLDVTVTASTMTSPSGMVTLIPRYVLVSTDGVVDFIPNTAELQIQFQATSENAQGAPDQSAIFPSPTSWSTDITELNAAPGNTDFKFVRYRVTFDIAKVGELDSTSRRPVLEFLRMPFKF